MNRSFRIFLGFLVLLAALAAGYAAVLAYKIPFAYMQVTANYDSDANLKTWDVLTRQKGIKEGDALVIVQPDGNYTLQVCRGGGVYDFRCIPSAFLESTFANLTKEYDTVWVFLYNGVLGSGAKAVPEAYKAVLNSQYVACFALPLYYGRTMYLKDTEDSRKDKATFAQDLLNYVSDIATDVDYRDLAVSFQKAKKYANAKAVLQEALKLFPTSPLLYRCLAECRVEADGLKAYDEIYKDNVMANVFTRSKTGGALLPALFQNAIYTSNSGDYKKARTLYFALLDLFRNQPDKILESQVRRYFVKDVLLPCGDTNEAINQLLADVNLESQDTAWSYNLVLDILDRLCYSNAAVSAGYGYFKSTKHMNCEAPLRYGKMALRFGKEEQLKTAIAAIKERNRFNPNLQAELRKDRAFYNAWTNTALRLGIVPFGGEQ